MTQIKVLSVNISEKKGTVKKPVDFIELYKHGVKKDAHSGPWNRMVSLLGKESFTKFEKDAKRPVAFGEFAENITTEGYEIYKMNPLDRLVNDHVELEVTQIGKECHGDRCAIYNEVGNCVMPKEGIFARVIKGGKMKDGDELTFQPKTYRALIITLSDRAHRGEYTDRSGPRIHAMLKDHFEANNKAYKIDTTIIPDDAKMLEILLQTAREDNIDIIITTGGTGIGPRDITVETVQPLLDKEIPGIMEMIRVKYGEKKPNALLSRGVSGVMANSLVYTLPGSVKAVNEYMTEILKTLDHLVYMLHSIDAH